MDQMIGKPILGFLPEPPSEVSMETGEVIFYRNLERERASPFWLYMTIGDWYESKLHFPRFSRTSVLIVYPLDPEQWEHREILGARIQFNHTFSQYPAFFQAGKTTRVDIFDGKTMASPANFKSLDVSSLQGSIVDTGGSDARFGLAESSLDSFGAIPASELVVIEYLDGTRYLTERSDLHNRLTRGTIRLPGIQKSLLNQDRITSQERKLRNNLLGQLNRTAGVSFAFISAIRAQREVNALEARNGGQGQSPKPTPRRRQRTDSTGSTGGRGSGSRRPRSNSSAGSQASSQNWRSLEVEDFEPDLEQ